MKLILSLKLFSRYLCQLDKLGFTLIELLMTIVVVGVLAVPLSLLVSAQFKSLNASGDLTTELNLARREMELLKNIPYANITSYSDPDYQGFGYTLTRTVSYINGSNTSLESLKNINVTVTKSGSTASPVTLITYLANNTNYGF